MKTGIPSYALRRAVTSLTIKRTPLHPAGPISYVHSVGVQPSVSQGQMLAKAVVDAKKAAPLRKQPLPSSGPGVTAQNGPHNGNILDMFNKPHTSSSSARQTFAHRSTGAESSQNLSVRATQPPPRAGSSGFASLYKQSDSFKVSPDPIDRLDNKLGGAAASRSSTVTSLVDFSDDDFSDDLDFEEPSTLPALSKQKPVQVDATVPTDPISGWSQSSPSHLTRPQPAQQSTKRKSPDNNESDPRITKRQLPWGPGRKDAENDKELHEAASRPTQKKDTQIWNKSVSDLTAQKKQLKTQHKGSASSKTETTAEEIHNIVSGTSRPRTSKKTAAIVLSEEQKHVKKLVVEQGQSVFFTGPAGTGKSVLMRAIISDLKKKHVRDPERIAVTASTGLAACNIGGMTLHSFSGIGLGKEDAQALVKKIRRNPKAKNRWLKVKTLVIDEISMVDGDLFDKLSQIGRIIRNNGRPWGGIQLVITGDFFQLPPVPDNSKQRDVKFAFDAATWNTSLDHTIGLTEVFRQKDPVFAEMLNEMRLGRISERTVQTFEALSRPLTFDDGLEVTELFPTRNEVENSNQKRLKALDGLGHRYDAIDTGDAQIRDRLLANMMAPPALELKKGAQVMLIKNMDETLVNGSLGTVIGFQTEEDVELMTSLDVEMMDGPSDIKKRIRAYSNALDTGGDKKKYPMVRFHAVDGTKRDLLCVPEDWKVELPTGEIQASRKQIPLILAWALSIHKAQGQTLDRVKVDLGKVFEKGQAYVALSRATTQQGLQVLRFRKDKVMAHPRVIGFYNQLYSVDMAAKKEATPMAKFVTKQPPAAAPAALAKPTAPTKPSGRTYIDVDDDEEEMAAAAWG